ncbi:MAG: hypothetical protein M0R40_07730 [Firmicutes bacterium]|nr:hypothetical protein [Bacillota bacterium]
MGATTWFSYQLSILHPNRKLENKGRNVFISSSEFEFEWVGNNELVIKVKENKRITHQSSRVGNVNITYVYEYKNIQH